MSKEKAEKTEAVSARVQNRKSAKVAEDFEKSKCLKNKDKSSAKQDAEKLKEEKTSNAQKQEKQAGGMSLKRKIIRSLIVLVVIGLVVLLGYYILVWTGAWEYINSVDKLRGLILSMGFWGRLTFVFIQFLQVTFLPIPSTISTLAGVLIYGPLETALLSLAGIMLGSVLAFWLGRVFGRKLVVFMVGKETCDKWTKFLTNAKYSFFFMMLFPMFPDDVLCLVAGLTDMSWAFFVLTNLLSRPIGIFMTCYLGSGQLIPYHGWGLIAWGFIVVAVIVIIFLSYKYRTQIENFMQKTFSSKKKTKLQTANVDVGAEAGKEISEKEKECKSEKVTTSALSRVKSRGLIKSGENADDIESEKKNREID